MIENGRKWLKGGWFANGSDFEKDMKPDHWKSGQMEFLNKTHLKSRKNIWIWKRTVFKWLGL